MVLFWKKTIVRFKFKFLNFWHFKNLYFAQSNKRHYCSRKYLLLSPSYVWRHIKRSMISNSSYQELCFRRYPSPSCSEKSRYGMCSTKFLFFAFYQVEKIIRLSWLVWHMQYPVNLSRLSGTMFWRHCIFDIFVLCMISVGYF